MGQLCAIAVEGGSSSRPVSTNLNNTANSNNNNAENGIESTTNEAFHVAAHTDGSTDNTDKGQDGTSSSNNVNTDTNTGDGEQTKTEPELAVKDYPEITNQNLVALANSAAYFLTDFVKDKTSRPESEAGEEDEDEPAVTLHLVPHVHTLFCERKQRVCGAVGKIQELEFLTLEVLEGQTLSKIKWLRSAAIDASDYLPIDGSEDLTQYQLSVHDVGCCISVRYCLGMSSQVHVSSAMGPVLPGPPRLPKLAVEGNLWGDGGYAVAHTEYIGGFEGASEFWWMRIRDGVREQVRDCAASDPLKPISYDPDVYDPRVYHLSKGIKYRYLVVALFA
jgi:hypothetical protein